MGFWLLYQLFPQSFIQGWQWQLSFFLNRIYWIYLNVFMINSMHCALPSHLKRQTSLNTFPSSLLPPVRRVSWLIRDPILQRMAEESRAQKRDKLGDLPFLVAELQQLQSILCCQRTESDQKWEHGLCLRANVITLYTQTLPPTLPPPKYSAVKRSR